MLNKHWDTSAPITVHIEVTEACNERCRHCYNFSRPDHIKPKTISQEDLDYTINELIDNKVMHVIITGGEPLLAMDKTCHLAQNVLEAGISVSLNSNLVACSKEKAKALEKIGIRHILTTLHSADPSKHDYIASTKGAYQKILQGIANAQQAGIRVTVNMIVSQLNKDDVLSTGQLCQSLGIKKFLANRSIPSSSNPESLDPVYILSQPDALKMFRDLKTLKEQGMEVGTCRMVPECLFPDRQEFSDFINRGCAAGKRHMLVNIDGTAHACVHDDQSYGNIHDIGIAGVWANMHTWRTDDYTPIECLGCTRLDTCEGGCRMVGLACTGEIWGADNLETYPISEPYRQENGFKIIQERGAKVRFIDDE